MPTTPSVMVQRRRCWEFTFHHILSPFHYCRSFHPRRVAGRTGRDKPTAGNMEQCEKERMLQYPCEHPLFSICAPIVWSVNPTAGNHAFLTTYPGITYAVVDNIIYIYIIANQLAVRSHEGRDEPLGDPYSMQRFCPSSINSVYEAISAHTTVGGIWAFCYYLQFPRRSGEFNAKESKRYSSPFLSAFWFNLSTTLVKHSLRRSMKTRNQWFSTK